MFTRFSFRILLGNFNGKNLTKSNKNLYLFNKVSKQYVCLIDELIVGNFNE